MFAFICIAVVYAINQFNGDIFLSLSQSRGLDFSRHMSWSFVCSIILNVVVGLIDINNINLP